MQGSLLSEPFITKEKLVYNLRRSAFRTKFISGVLAALLAVGFVMPVTAKESEQSLLAEYEDYKLRLTV